MNSVISGFYSSSINLIILFLMLACILICLCSHVLTKILCYILFFLWRFDPIPSYGLPLRDFAITLIGHITLGGALED